ncbi:MAG: xanthine dehydrogenase family protein subunit M [bacterium]
MHRTLRPFELLEPDSVAEAVRLLGAHEGRARVLAGGIDLIAKMRRWQLAPECLVSIRRIPRLDRLEVNGAGELEIGSLVSLRALELSPLVREGWPVLHEAVQQIASVQVKTMGTVIGNLCVATPASDVAVALYVLDARITLVGPERERTLPIDEFFLPVATSVLGTDEVVTGVAVPPLVSGTGAAFLKLAHTKACIAKVNVAALLTHEAGLSSKVRIALGAVGPTVIRARQAEAVLAGRAASPELIARAAGTAAQESEPQDDLRASAGYRRRMVEVLVGRALTEAARSAGMEATP